MHSERRSLGSIPLLMVIYGIFVEYYRRPQNDSLSYTAYFRGANVFQHDYITMETLTMTKEQSDFEKANQKVHKVEDHWSFEHMTKHGWIPQNKEGVGFVRNFVYHHPILPNEIFCATGFVAGSLQWSAL